MKRLFKRTSEPDETLASLMEHSHEFIVCLGFQQAIPTALRGDVLNERLRDARVIDASRRFARAMGFDSRQDMIGVHATEFLKGPVPPWFVEYGNEVEATGYKDLDRIVSVPAPDGTVSHMRIYMQNIIEDDFLVSQWITLRDANEETRQKQKLESSERLKSIALAAAKLHTFSIDFETLELQFDVDDGVLRGDRSLYEWASLIHPEDRRSALKDLDKFRNGAVEDLHLVFRFSGVADDDRWIEVWGKVTGRDAANQAVGLTGVYRDVTDERAEQAKLESMRKLETLGRLAGGVAHDFNNLLMTISGSAEIARLGEEGAQAEFERIQEATLQASRICNQLLSYAGERRLPKRAVELGDVVTRAIELIPAAIAKNANVQILESEPVWVSGQTTQLIQVATNLITNAAEAITSGAGELEIRVGACQYEETWATTHHLGMHVAPGTYGFIEVRDNGEGMQPEQVEKLFDPFFSTKFSGRGLGMAVVLGVVREHEGAIHVRSQPKIGTTVRVVIPIAETQPLDSGDAVVPRTATLRTGRVLVVDDEPAVRETVRRMLERTGWEVDTASGGAEALRLLATTNAFDAILMDVTMPEMSGVEAAERILALHPDARVALTSGYTDIDISDTLASKVAFIQKPYRADRLDRLLGTLLEQRPGEP